MSEDPHAQDRRLYVYLSRVTTEALKSHYAVMQAAEPDRGRARQLTYECHLAITVALRGFVAALSELPPAPLLATPEQMEGPE